MRHINLLPWREEQRQLSQRRFYQYTAGVAAAVMLLVVIVAMELHDLIATQQQRNAYLRQQIQKIDSQIGVVEGVSDVRKRMNQRLAMVRDLEQKRIALVHIFDALPRTVPAGVALEELKQNGDNWQIRGIGHSNSEISRFIHKLDDSPWFQDAHLSVVNAGTDGKQQDSHFVLDVQSGQSGARK